MTFKILSLDGGGMRGVISAQILKEIEDKVGQPLHEYFDLIAGTSTGSILAAGIACGMSADDLVKFYEKHGQDIFLERIRWQRKFRWLSRAMGGNVLYPHEVKGLVQVFKEWVINKLYPDEVINKLCPDKVKDKDFKDFREDVINKRYPDKVNDWRKWVISVIHVLPHEESPGKGWVQVFKEWVINKLYPDEVINKLYSDKVKDNKFKGFREDVINKLYPDEVKGWKKRVINVINILPHKKRSDKGLANVLKKKLKLNENDPYCPTMADIKKPQLLIPAYDVSSRYTKWFANDDPKEWWYDNTKLWEICTASASAPTFFPPYRLNGLPHIDGGVSTNNPTAAAIAHALCMQNAKVESINEIAVLSIGTGQTTHPYTYNEIKKWGLKDWALNITDIFLDPSAENSEHISMRMFLGVNRKNYLRLNFKLQEPEKKFILIRIGEFVLRIIKELFSIKNEENTDIKNLKIKKDKSGYKNTFEISQNIEIDNPGICKNLIEGSEVYLRDGEVQYDKKKDGDKMKVNDAIDKFFGIKPVKQENEKNDDEKQDKKHLLEA